MSDYGADSPPYLSLSWDLVHTKKMIELEKVNAMEWTYSGYKVCKLAHRKSASNILFKIQQ